MAWYFPRLTQRAFPQAAGLGGIGLGLLRPSVLPEGVTATQPDGVEAFGHTIGNFCSSLCSIRYTTGSSAGVVECLGNPHSMLNRGKLCVRSCGRASENTDRIKTPLNSVFSRSPGSASLA